MLNVNPNPNLNLETCHRFLQKTLSELMNERNPKQDSLPKQGGAGWVSLLCKDTGRMFTESERDGKICRKEKFC